MSVFAERLKELRKLNSLTQKELALEIEKPQSTITKWENGQLEPNIEMLVRLAEYFDVRLDFLMGRKN